jgi:inhibitor of KinA
MAYGLSQFRIMGDRALLVELGDRISPGVNRRVRELFIMLEKTPIKGVLETIPAYRSLLIIYDPLITNTMPLQHQIEDLQKKSEVVNIPEPKAVEIPVVYGGEYGPDLEWVARYHNIGVEEVVQLHTATTYQVYMIGFTPGFPYMGELPERLDTPRRETPRTTIPEGSVAIAQRQTGIYPVESPGGWHILGRTPMKLFNPLQIPPTLLEMGDLARFYPIKEVEFTRWQQ